MYRFFDGLGRTFLDAAQWGGIAKACGIMLNPSRTPLENLPHVGKQIFIYKHLMELVTGEKRFDREVCKSQLPRLPCYFSRGNNRFVPVCRLFLHMDRIVERIEISHGLTIYFIIARELWLRVSDFFLPFFGFLPSFFWQN